MKLPAGRSLGFYALAAAVAFPVGLSLCLLVAFVTAKMGIGAVAYPLVLLAILGSILLPVAAVVLGLRGIARRLQASGEPGVGLSIAGLLLGIVELVPTAIIVGKILNGGLAHGRPLRIRGQARTAPARAAAGWAVGPLPDVRALDALLRAALAAAWSADAAPEHASVAAFAQLSLALVGLGAPPDLVARAHRAAGEEIGHASRCYAFAGAYAGHPVSAGPLPALLDGLGRQDRAGVAVESLRDGCLGEGLSAEVARAEAAAAHDPVVRDFLATVAIEEADHAELAWDVLAFCLSEGDAATWDAVRTASRELSKAPPRGVADEAVSLTEHGRLAGAQIREIEARTRRAVSERLTRLLEQANRGRHGATQAATDTPGEPGASRCAAA